METTAAFQRGQRGDLDARRLWRSHDRGLFFVRWLATARGYSCCVAPGHRARNATSATRRRTGANEERACVEGCQARRRAGCRKTDCQLGKCVSGLARRVNEIPEAGAEFGYFYMRPNARVNRRQCGALTSELNLQLGWCAEAGMDKCTPTKSGSRALNEKFAAATSLPIARLNGYALPRDFVLLDQFAVAIQWFSSA
jgi:hypothetical protein